MVGYYGTPVKDPPAAIADELKGLDPAFFSGDKLVVDPAMALHLVRNVEDPRRTLWVFRYYDLDDRKFKAYGDALARLVDFIRALAMKKGQDPPKVNVIAHSMGGLIVREAIQSAYPRKKRKAEDFLNKVVTLGTPHQGISFQVLKNWIAVDAAQELERFNPDSQADAKKAAAFFKISRSVRSRSFSARSRRFSSSGADGAVEATAGRAGTLPSSTARFHFRRPPTSIPSRRATSDRLSVPRVAERTASALNFPANTRRSLIVRAFPPELALRIGPSRNVGEAA